MVAQEGPDSNPQWSPDGSQLAFVTAMGKPSYFFQNSVIADDRVRIDDGRAA